MTFDNVVCTEQISSNIRFLMKYLNQVNKDSFTNFCFKLYVIYQFIKHN